MSIKQRIGVFLALIILLAVPGLQAIAASAQETDVLALLEERQRAVAELMEASTVYVLLDKGDSYSMGSAFIVAEGYAVTNAHVVGSAKGVLLMNSRLRPVKASVVRKEYDDETGGNDFALLRFSSSAKLPVLSFTLRVNRMDRVSAWGFPVLVTQFDQSFDVILEGKRTKTPPVVYTEGTVSAVVERRGQKTVIHSAAIAGGNSGGPLVNARGEVVGINTWGYTEEDEGAFVNASIPSERIVDFLLKAGVKPQMSRQSPELARTPLPVPLPAPLPEEPKKPAPSVELPAPPMEDDDGNEELFRMARAGDVDAQAALGAMYYDGDGVPQDTKQAVQWLEKAVKGGSEEGKALLGVMLVFEEDVADPKKGVRLLREAASSVDEDGWISGLLGRIYYEGEIYGVPRDLDESFRWAGKAAEGGDPDGTALLGMLYYFGEGTDEDDELALELTEQAVEEDSSLGKAILAWMYYDGVAVDEDLETALALATDAAEEEEALAQGLLALMYAEGHGVERDVKSAEGWARRAADQGNEFGWFVLGSLYMRGEVVKKDPAMAWAYLDLAAKRSVANADERLEELEKTISSRDKKRAQELQKQWRKEWGLSR